MCVCYSYACHVAVYQVQIAFTVHVKYNAVISTLRQINHIQPLVLRLYRAEDGLESIQKDKKTDRHIGSRTNTHANTC